MSYFFPHYSSHFLPHLAAPAAESLLGLFARLRRTVHRQAAHLACSSPLYNWSLGGPLPDKLLFHPANPWPGSAERGRSLIRDGVFDLEGDRLPLYGENWEPAGIDPAWFDHLHGFDWLQDLRALGGNEGRSAARAMIESWIHRYWHWHEKSWRPDLLGRRITNWINAFGFCGESASESFQELFFDSLLRQLRHLSRALPGGLEGLPLLQALQGLAYGGMVLEGRQACLEQALELLDKEIPRQILSDGGHISRSPQQLALAAALLIDLRSALKQGQYPCPAFIQHALDRAIPALRFFRHGDRHFALFNGTQEGDETFIKAIFVQTGSKARTPRSLPHSGYERLAQGRALLIMDTGAPPPRQHDRHAHAAPLAFEFSYGRERIFVACGTHPTSCTWQDSLRNTAAHNTLTIDDRNACEIGQDGHFNRHPDAIAAHRDEKDGMGLIDASHNGYSAINGITHTRRVFLTDQGHDLRGEDTLTCATGLLTRAHRISLRFHLHPSVLVSLVKGGTQALLRLKSGTGGWRFASTGGLLSLENSIYLGSGARPRKTKQLIISAPMREDLLRIKWALRRENAP